MFRFVRLVALGMLCGGMGIAVVVVALGQSGFVSSSGGVSALVVERLSADALVVPGVQWLVGDEQLASRERARHASPQALFARRASRTAFEHLGGRSAIELSRAAFPDVVERPDGGPPVLGAGERIARYIGSNAAAVLAPGGRHAVIESLGPIARREGPGRFAPLNLRLVDVGGAYVPVSSTLDVRVPKRLGDGVRLPGSGVSLTPSDAGGAPLSGSVGSIDGSSVIYTNTQADADTLVKPTVTGFEIDSLLRSIDSPTRLHFHVAMPAGAALVQRSGAALARVIRRGRTIATISASAAQDAAGASVPLALSVHGHTVAIAAEVRAGEYQYPVLVDPEVNDEQLTGHEKPTNWKFCASDDKTCTGHSSGKFTSSGWGGTGGLTDEPLTEYKPGKVLGEEGDWVSISYQTQGESKIYRVQGSASGSNPAGNVETAAMLTAKGPGEKPVSEDVKTLSKPPETSYSYPGWVACPESGVNCTAGAGSAKNAFSFAEAFTGTGTSFKNTISSATVSISQVNPPAVSFYTGEEKFANGRQNVLYGAGSWLGPYAGAYEAIASDLGVGLSFVSVVSGPGTWKVLHPYLEEGLCSGVQCKPEVKGPETYFTYNSELKDGEDYVEATAYNATGAHTSKSMTLKVDGTVPYNLTLSGLPASGEVNEQPYRLRAQATDGTAPTPSSGIRSVAISIDGRELLGKPSSTCTPGPCVGGGEWTLNGEGLGAGEHELDVIATDNAGNVASREYFFTVRHAEPLGAGPGSVDPTTGALSLSSTDVSIAGGLGSLVLSRTYNSRQLTAGADGPLGSQWALSVGAEQKLEKTPSGDVVLIGGEGGLTTFQSDKKGGFVSPEGDRNLTLSEVKEGEKTKEFLLKNPAAGTTVHFTLAEGATEGLYYPSLSEGVLASGTQSYAFRTVEVEGKKLTEPTQALAPAPAGVSCSPTLIRGCRALKFKYATGTTAAGEAPSEWGDYNNRLKEVLFVAYDPSSKTMQEPAVADYSYDASGRLRAEWDPRISPALKTTYGYDGEGRVVAVSPPGRQPFLFHYGILAGDSVPGRLLSILRPSASTALASSPPPANTAAPQLSMLGPKVGTLVSVSSNGSWSNSPLGYFYQWEDCSAAESECKPIAGAVNQSYMPQARDAGYRLRAQVTALNADGAGTAMTVQSATLALTAPSFSLVFGSSGSEVGKFSKPGGDAIDPKGNVWVADSANNRVEKFNASGGSPVAYGTLGSGNLQFKAPAALAIDPEANVYVADKGNSRIEELNEKGEFVRAFASAGSGNGQLKEPQGVALDGLGDVWVADSANNRVQEFSSTGVYMGAWGSLGSGNGQFKTPTGIAVVGEQVFVADQGNNRVEVLSLAGAYLTQFGSAGSGNGQFSAPTAVAADPLGGELLVTDRGNGRIEAFSPAGGFLFAYGSKGTGNGQFTEPEGVAVNAAGEAYVVDTANSRVQELAHGYPTSNPAPAPPSAGSSAITTFDYGVPVSGAGAPYALGASEAAKWGQSDDPVEATAVFPPDTPEGWPAQAYTRATITYLDATGHAVNVAAPGGAIATSEYNETSNMTRTLSAANRATALEAGANSATVSKTLDTQSTYNEEGTELLETLGPEHKVKLSSGSEVNARAHTVYSYDEGAPEAGGPYRLVTKTTTGAKYGALEADVRTTTTSYSGQANLGWRLRKPTSTTTDPAGLKLIHTTIYDPVTGNVTETRTPGAGPANGPTGAYGYISQINNTSPALNKPTDMAVDFKSGHVWVVETGASRLDEYSSSGEYLGSFGSEGTGNGQFKEPHGVAVDSSGDVWVADTRNNRVQELSPAGEYIAKFGTEGSGNGQFKLPWDVSFDLSGNLWIADAGNSRVQEISATGTFIRKFGSEGSGNGQFKAGSAPGSVSGMWIAVDADHTANNVWVSDWGNNRVQEFNKEGAYTRQFGSEGSGNGQFKSPEGVELDPNAHVFVADKGNNRVQEFSSEGAYMTQLGSEGTGNGQFKQPAGLAIDPYENRLWVADAGNNRAQRFTSSLSYMLTVASTLVPLNVLTDVAVDKTSGHVWVLETGANRLDEYSSSGEFLGSFGSQGSGNGQFKEPHGVAVDSSGDVWVADTKNNRVQELSPSGAYMSKFGTEGSGNGQFKSPWDVSLDSFGNVWVADAGNSRVQELTTAGAFVRKFGSEGSGNGQFKTGPPLGSPAGMWLVVDTGSTANNVWVSDWGNNRVQEFSKEGVYTRQFGAEGSGNGQFKSPEGVATDSNGHVFVADRSNNRIQEFSNTGTYMATIGEYGKGNGQLWAPAGLGFDASNKLWVADVFNSRAQQFAISGAKPGVSQTIYYSAGANTAYPQCGEHAEWANLPCQAQLAAQPKPSAAPQLPIVSTAYNIWDEPETTTETVGTTTRTKTTTYDSAGRELTASVSSSIGTALPATKDEYDEPSGALTKQKTTVGETTKTVTSALNTLGELTSYTDADGNVSTYTYNLDGQVEEMSDGKGSQIYVHDATTGLLTKLQDSAAGSFTAGYDVEGRMTNEGYPNGMSAKYKYDAAGAATAMEYVKTTNCSEKCTWYSETLAPAIGGETRSATSTLASDAFTYDAAGRLSETQETPAGAGCKTRVYAYDVEDNRLSLTSREPGTEGKCASTGGTVETHTYDEANRVIDTGIVYDAFGDTTKLPAADAGGNEVTSTYYSSGQLLSQTQSGKTLTYGLDPGGRIRETVTTGSGSGTVISHYAGPGGRPIWTSESAEHWTRNIPGIDGALAATQQNGETPVLQLHDLQGDVVATAALNETETKLLSTYNSTEFGVPTTGSPPKYSWLGASGVATELPSGISNSSTTSYIPQLGRTLQTEPIVPPGASPEGTFTGTPYVTQMEPWVATSVGAWAAGATEREAARLAAQAAAAAAAASDGGVITEEEDAQVTFEGGPLASAASHGSPLCYKEYTIKGGSTKENSLTVNIAWCAYSKGAIVAGDTSVKCQRTRYTTYVYAKHSCGITYGKGRREGFIRAEAWFTILDPIGGGGPGDDPGGAIYASELIVCTARITDSGYRRGACKVVVNP
jgi:YD repeat-containing protein